MTTDTAKPDTTAAATDVPDFIGVLTSGKDPSIVLRIINEEVHDEDIASELAAKVRDAFQGDSLPVVIGTHSAT